MKIKHILIVSIILAIFTIGAVSASEDLNITDDTLAAEDVIDDSIAAVDDSDSEVDDEPLAAVDDSDSEVDDDSLGETNQDVVSTIDPNKIYCVVNNGVNYDNASGVLTFVSKDPTAKGKLLIYVENTIRVDKTIDYSDYKDGTQCVLTYTPYELGIKSDGPYNGWRVTLNGELVYEGNGIRINPYTFECTDTDGDIITDYYYEYGDPITVYVNLPTDAKGKVKLVTETKTYYVELSNGFGTVDIDTTGWSLTPRTGTSQGHKITMQYDGDGKYYQRVYDYFLALEPGFTVPSVMAIHEDEFIKISAPASVSGEINLTVNMWDEVNKIYNPKSLTTLRLSQGSAQYALSSFDEGNYQFFLTYKIASFSGTVEAYLDVLRNSPRITASITPSEIYVGEQVNIQIKGPKLQETNVYIYVDDVYVKAVLLDTGKLNEVLFNLPVGNHKVNVFLYNSKEKDGLRYFYSYTKNIVVKEKPKPPVYTISLKKVAVSRSAKKLVLSATVKADGVVKSGQTVKFTFNGKTYSAKTNAKGVASVTIKSTVLKKLKAGKTITYKAVSNSKTAKVSVKVKK